MFNFKEIIMKGILNIIFGVLGVYCLFIAYKEGFDTYWLYEHKDSPILKPAQYISLCWVKIFNVDPWDVNLRVKSICLFTFLGIFLLGCCGRFFFFGISSSDESSSDDID